MKAAIKSGLLALAAIGIPAVAHAHTGVGDTGGLVHGFMHPIGGLDHVLAMVAVGVFASILGGRALWLVPTSFVVMMAVGGVLGMQGVSVPFVEIGIAASVVVLGLAVALRWNPPTAAAMGVVSLFAIFHGHAHGAEMPLDASGLQYAIGFMAATALLHIAGVGLGVVIGRISANSTAAMRFGGGAMALAGVGLLTGYI
ncbi:hypothetical protein LPJGGPFB_05219 [Ensifer adhaerens]|uniref:Urease accessory protein n=1 Tax=Ensifer adhaerens TaxID=106592 RepID=A0ACC5T6K0_ENSAD|nr:HupE/UreJ family protein [Ensifer adhaerens]MBP1876314.1 urease accessory protein [Ensifer adhaerens]NRP21960.1 hypothetical protein [Ensifer adhaerens]